MDRELEEEIRKAADRKTVSDAVSDFMDNEQNDCDALVIVWIDKEGYTNYIQSGFSGVRDILGALDMAKDIILRPNIPEDQLDRFRERGNEGS